MIGFLENFWNMSVLMAPYLLLGFTIAGLLSGFVNQSFILKHLGESNFSAIFKASILGVPLPLCSCSVLPVASSIHFRGGSKPATVSFLLSTPQTGVDSIMVTYGVLGWPLALFRPIWALLTGIIGGMAIQFGVATMGDKQQKIPVKEEHKRKSIKQMTDYAFVMLPKDIGKSLLIGLVISALISSIFTENSFQDYAGSGLIGTLVIILLSIPFYVCATGSVPIALSILHLGGSLGAVTGFLIAGPATNTTAISAITKILGKQITVIYLLVVFTSALTASFFIDYYSSYFMENLSILKQVHGHPETSLFGSICAVVLLGLCLQAFVPAPQKAIPPSCCANKKEGAEVSIQVRGMSCLGCVKSIESNLKTIQGVEEVTASLDSQLVNVIGKNLNVETLKSVLGKLGYL